MSHSAVHLAFGMLVASLLCLPRIARAWRAGRPLALPIGAWLLACYGLGLFAALPGLLDQLGVPDGICTGWWMNLFLLHPFIRALNPGGDIPGTIALGFFFVVQYTLLLLALRRVRREA